MKKKPSAIAKLSVPILSGIVPRERLFRLLDHGRKQPILWVSGPAGSGKTTLIASYLENRKLPCLWYRMDERDSDIATFFHYLGMGAKWAARGKGKALPHFTPEHNHGLPEFTHQFFEFFFSRLPTPFSVVFDNHQEVPVNSQVLDVLVNGLSHIPAGINVTIISRRNPDPQFISLRASGKVDVIGWNDIRITPKEFERIARRRKRVRQPGEKMREFYEKTDGWAAGLVLILDRSKLEDISPHSVSHHPPEELFEYFGKEVFEKTESNVKDFLLKTSFFPNMTSRVARELTGEKDTDRILSYITRNNYFTAVHSHSSPVYQYHPLFRDFLRSRAVDRFSEDELLHIKSQAGLLLAESGQIEDSVDLLCETGQCETLVPQVLRKAQSLIAQGRSSILKKWLECIPKKTLEGNPWLQYWLGMCHSQSSSSQSRDFLEKSYWRFREIKELEGMFLAWTAIVDTFSSEMRYLKPLDGWIMKLEEIMASPPEFPSIEIEAKVTSSMLFAALFRKLSHPKIDFWVEKANFLLRKNMDPNLKLQVATRLLRHYIYEGDLHNARTVTEVIRKAGSSPSSSPRTRLTMHLDEARFALYTADFEECLDSVSSALDTARTTGLHDLDYIILGQGASAALGLKDYSLTDDFLEKMAPVLETNRPFDASFYHFLRSLHHVMKGDTSNAIFHSESSLELASGEGFTYGQAMAQILMVWIHHQRKENTKARECLNTVKRTARLIKSNSMEFNIRLADAALALDRGDEKSGVNYLRKGFAIGRKNAYFHWITFLPDVMTQLCMSALDSNIEVEYVKELIDKRNLLPDIPPYHIDGWPWNLKIYTLGRFELVKDNEQLRFSGKVQQKPLTMLKAIIALGGKGVNKHQLADILWPDADADHASKSLKTTLHRLRQLLGKEEAVRLSKGNVTLDRRHCWTDVWAFERLIEEVDDVIRKGPNGKDLSRAVGLCEKAMAIYKGSLLPRDSDEIWTLSLREKLRTKFLRSVEFLGMHWENAGNFQKAIGFYKKGLEVDSLAEEFYRGLMSCYVKIGRKSEALATFKSCREIFSAVLDIEPSPRIKEIYESLSDE